MVESSHHAGSEPNQRSDEEIHAYTIGEPQVLASTVEIVDYDPEWPRIFEREATRIRALLGELVVRLEHVGSTSVPGLAAKPKIDMLLALPIARTKPPMCHR